MKQSKYIALISFQLLIESLLFPLSATAQSSDTGSLSRTRSDMPGVAEIRSTGTETSHDAATPTILRQTRVELPRVMLIVFGKSSDDVIRIVEYLQLRMFELDVKFGVRWIRAKEPGNQSEIDIARSLMSEENLQLVFFWNASQRDTLYFVTADSGEIVERKIDDVGEESRPEAISIVVQTAIESLLESGELKPTETEVQPVEEPRENGAPISQSVKKPPLASVLRPAPKTPQLYAQMSYQLDSFNSTPTLLHTGNLRLGYQPSPFMRLYAGIGVSNHLFSEEDGIEMKQFRVPVEIGGLAMFNRSTVVIGAGASVLIVPVKNMPGATIEDADMKNAYWSQGVMAKLFIEFQYRFSQYFEFYTDLHLLMDVNMVTYKVKNGPTLFDEYRRVKPGFQAGITFFLF